MKKICAWCKKDLFDEKHNQSLETGITHGICADCLKKYFSERPLELVKYLDGLLAPVLLIDPGGVVKTANKAAQSLLGKKVSLIENFKGGNVFECIYASLPEGCGKTVHCSGCAVRRSVTYTYTTGKPLYKSSAYLRQYQSDSTKEQHYLISTEKVGDIVLLRIDEVKK
jgi:hypothetical protein